tara:strand:- start:70 stop:837 length:768 start_codon:yes stop_codon:yes gene_type:complete
MTIQQMLFASGKSEVPLEYFYTCRANGFTDGAYSQSSSVPHSGFTHNDGTPKSSRTSSGTGAFTTSWNHAIDRIDGLVFYVEAVNSNSIYLDHTSSSSETNSIHGNPFTVNTEVYIWNLGNSQYTNATSTNIIKQYNFNASIYQNNSNNSAFSFIPTGALVNGVVDTVLLTAGNYYAVGVNYKYIGNSTSTVNGTYLDLVTNSLGQKTQSSVIWQDGTHAVNIKYFNTPQFTGYTSNGTTNVYGQVPWWKWRRAE